MKNQSPDALISIIICIYNAGEYLRPSVESILNQTYRNIEVLLIDDGSTDNCLSTLEGLSDPRIRKFSQKNQGKPAALNFALKKLHGEFYAIHDADDLSDPERIEKQVQCMLDHPGTAAVFCGHELILNGQHVGPILSFKNHEECRKDVVERMRMPAHDPTAMYRVSMVEGYSYDEELLMAQGLDYTLRVGERFPMMVLGECLYSYRIKSNTITKRDPTARQKLVLKVMIKANERRGLPLENAKMPTVSTVGDNSNRGRDNDLVSHFMASMVDLLHAGKRLAAISDAITCARLHPLDPYYYKPLVYALSPISLIDKYRGAKKANFLPKF